MYWLLTIPFVIQAIVIGLDEYVFHLKRDLPKWERIGHPLDTFSVLICLLFIVVVPFSEGSMKVYIAMALFSCLFITKDEFIHHECCSAAEQWLHSILFVNHSLVLMAAGLMWPFLHSDKTSYWLLKWLNEPHFFKVFLIVQIIFMIAFMGYQIIYWNFIWKPKKK